MSKCHPCPKTRLFQQENNNRVAPTFSGQTKTQQTQFYNTHVGKWEPCVSNFVPALNYVLNLSYLFLSRGFLISLRSKGSSKNCCTFDFTCALHLSTVHKVFCKKNFFVACVLQSTLKLSLTIMLVHTQDALDIERMTKNARKKQISEQQFWNKGTQLFLFC